MPHLALENCSRQLADALPPLLEEALLRLIDAKDEPTRQSVLVTVERLMKMAKTAADSVERADPDGRTESVVRMRSLTIKMTEHVHRIADRSPYADEIRKVLE